MHRQTTENSVTLYSQSLTAKEYIKYCYIKRMNLLFVFDHQFYKYNIRTSVNSCDSRNFSQGVMLDFPYFNIRY